MSSLKFLGIAPVSDRSGRIAATCALSLSISLGDAWCIVSRSLLLSGGWNLEGGALAQLCLANATASNITQHQPGGSCLGLYSLQFSHHTALCNVPGAPSHVGVLEEAPASSTVVQTAWPV